MADFKAKYASNVAITITLTSLATSSTKVAGRSSDVIDNSTNLYVDALVSGYVKTGTSPAAPRSIDVWVWAKHSNDTYPDAVTGSDANTTWTSVDIRNASARCAGSAVTDSTTGRVYHFAPFSVAALFGGVMPKKWGIFVAHDTNVNLSSTSTDHVFHYTGVHYQSV